MRQPCLDSSARLCAARRRASSKSASSSTSESAARGSAFAARSFARRAASSFSSSSKPSLKARLLCARDLASCGRRELPNRRSTMARTTIHCQGLSNMSKNLPIINSPPLYWNGIVSTDTSRQIPVAAVRLVEKVFAPSLVRPPDVAHDLAVDVQREGARSPNQMHARFLGRAAPLLVVATLAAHDQIVPSALAAARARQH